MGNIIVRQMEGGVDPGTGVVTTTVPAAVSAVANPAVVSPP